MMRLGTFMLGGLVGAAAVMYMSDRRNRSMKFTAFTSPADTFGKVMGGTIGLINSLTDKNKMSTAASQTPAAGNPAASATNNQVQQMVNQDPNAKKAVDDILQDNGNPSVNLQ